MNESGEAVRGLVKNPVELPPAQTRRFFSIMRSPVHANFGLAESTETSIKCYSISLIFPRGKGLFSYTDLQNGECEELWIL